MDPLEQTVGNCLTDIPVFYPRDSQQYGSIAQSNESIRMLTIPLTEADGLLAERNPIGVSSAIDVLELDGLDQAPTQPEEA